MKTFGNLILECIQICFMLLVLTSLYCIKFLRLLEKIINRIIERSVNIIIKSITKRRYFGNK